MEVETVSTADQSLLRGIRRALAGADSALLCVAFVHPRGVHLLGDELRPLRDRARLVATTTFDRSGGAALAVACRFGTQVRTLNPAAGSTYHPKVYIGRRGDSLHAFVGSANLTGGLATNVEVGVMLRGTADDKALHDLNLWAEGVYERSSTWRAVDGAAICNHARGRDRPGEPAVGAASTRTAHRHGGVRPSLRRRAGSRDEGERFGVEADREGAGGVGADAEAEVAGGGGWVSEDRSVAAARPVHFSPSASREAQSDSFAP